MTGAYEPRIGDEVRIIDGPFEYSQGRVDDIRIDKRKVKVVVSFHGRETPLELNFEQVALQRRTTQGR